MNAKKVPLIISYILKATSFVGTIYMMMNPKWLSVSKTLEALKSSGKYSEE
jgi:hypothetical protein